MGNPTMTPHNLLLVGRSPELNWYQKETVTSRTWNRITEEALFSRTRDSKLPLQACVLLTKGSPILSQRKIYKNSKQTLQSLMGYLAGGTKLPACNALWEFSCICGPYDWLTVFIDLHPGLISCLILHFLPRFGLTWPCNEIFWPGLEGLFSGVSESILYLPDMYVYFYAWYYLQMGDTC